MLIRFAQYQFVCSEPFGEGHRLTAEEARVFNAYRADSIAKNLKRKFAALPVEGASALIPAGALADFQATLSRYDEDFAIGKGFSAPKPGIIQAEARRIATARLPGSASRADISAFALQPEVLEEARQRIAERAAIIAAGVEDLIT